MYRILLAVDESETRAQAAARAIADLPGDADEKRVTILHSFTENPRGGSAVRVESVRAAGDLFDEAGIDYEIDETSGDPSDAILGAAADVDADLIVVGGRKRSPTGKAIFGSVTQAVILNGDRPVLVAGESPAE